MLQLIQQFNKNGLRILFANVYTLLDLVKTGDDATATSEPTEEVATPTEGAEVEAPADAEVAA